MRRLVLSTLILCCGCTVIQPGHLGLRFSASSGLQREVLPPGLHRIPPLGKIDDFDVTYSTHREELHTVSAEGLGIDLSVSIIYRPVRSQLYELDSEVGLNYYDEVVGPEFRTATRGVFARHSYLETQRMNEKVEDEIEAEVRRRIAGKHIEISSVTLGSIRYAPQITEAVQSKIVGEQEAARRKAAQLADVERARLDADAALRKKQLEQEIADKDAAISRTKAETDAAVRATRARAEAEERTLLAKAHAEEKRAETTALTPLGVMMHAYDALAKLGGAGTTILLGDWSKVPSFLFPAGSMYQVLAGATGAKSPPASK